MDNEETTEGSEECGLNEEGEKDNVDQENQEDGHPRKKRKRNSPMWQHFTCRISDVDNYEYAHCNYCIT